MSRIVRLHIALLLLCGAFSLWLGGSASAASAARTPAASLQPLRAALAFEPNRGQTDASVDYFARGPGYALWLAEGEATLRLRGDTPTVLRWRLLDATPAAPRAEAPLTGRSHYLTLDGSAPAITQVPHQSRVRYPQVWPGIDLLYYGTAEGRLEYDFVLAPGADPTRIAFRVEGAERLALNARGGLDIHTAGGVLTQHAPVLYQSIGARRVPIAGRFVVHGDTVRFAVDDYDRSFALVIDPVLVWSSFLGGNGDDRAFDVAERNGEVYVTGLTLSTNFPTTAGALQVNAGGGADCYITKFAASGASLVYSTYLGGLNDQYCNAIAVSNDGSAFVAGILPSASGDAFLAKLTATGSALAYPTVIRAGSARDEAVAIDVTGAGVATVAGYTDSTDFPTTAGVAQASDGPGRGAFAFRVNAAGALLWSTYLDGAGDQIAYGVAIDGANDAYVAGSTTESDAAGDGFVVKLNGSGGAVYTGARVAGNGADAILDVQVDAASGETFVTGYTESSNLPTTAGALQGFWSGDRDAFLARINAAGNGFVSLTYLGGPRTQSGNALARDNTGNIYVTGRSDIADVAGNIFLLKTGPAANQVHYNLQFGGNAADAANGLSVASNGDAWLSGTTASADFPATAGAFDTAKGVGQDAFVMKIGPQVPVTTLVSNVTVAGTTVGPNGANTNPAVTLQPGDLVTVESLGGSVNFHEAGPCTPDSYTVGPAGHPTSRNPITPFGLCYSADHVHLPDPIPDADGYGHAGLFRPTQSGIGPIRFIGAGSESFTYSGGASTTLRLGVNDQPDTPTAPAPNSGQFNVRVTIERAAVPLNVSFLSVNAPALVEGNGGSTSMVFTVTLAPASAQTVTVRAQTSDRTALAGSDYTAVSQTLTFAPGQTSQTVNVPILGDTAIEPDERLSLELINPVNASTANPRGIGTIVGDDLPALTINDVSVAEGDSGTTNATFTVSLSPAVSFPVSVSAYSANGSASAGSDYTAATTTLTFAAGETSNPFAVAVSGDDAVEANETFVVNLSNASGATIADGQGQGTIQNDDATGNLGFASTGFTVGENAGTVTVDVTRQAGDDGAVSVQYAIANGSAIAPGDWTASPTSGTLTFNDGETLKSVQFSVVNDALDEVDGETVVLTLSNATGGATLRNTSSTVTLLDDDPLPTLSVDGGGCSVSESAGACAFVARLSTASGRAVSFNSSTAAGTATDGADYTGHGVTPHALQIGETSLAISVPVTNDALIEPSETFSLILSSISNANPAGGLSATGTIIDNDAGGALAFAQAAYSVNEFAGTVTITVTRSGGTASGVSVQYVASNGSATAPADYTSASGTLTFGAGETSKTFSVTIANDALDENDETFAITLSNPAGGATLGTPSSTTVTILDEDATPALSIADATHAEGDTGTSTETLQVALSAASGRAVSVNWFTNNAASHNANGGFETPVVAGGGAQTFTIGQSVGGWSVESGSVDLVGTAFWQPAYGLQSLDLNGGAVSQDLTLVPGQAYTISFQLAGPNCGPPVKTVELSWAGTVVGVYDFDSTGRPSTFPIADLGFAVHQVGVTAAAATQHLTLRSLTPSDCGPVLDGVHVKPAGDATGSGDFDFTQGTLNFAPGETAKTIPVPVRGDYALEPDEVMYVDMSAAVNAALPDPRGLVTIQNDDVAGTIALEFANYAVNENVGTLDVRALRTGGQAQDVGAMFATAPGTALAGSDFTALTRRLSFAGGQAALTATIAILDDAVVESSESFSVGVSGAFGGAALGTSNANVAIADNDEGAGTLQFSAATYSANENAGVANLTVTRSGGSAGAVAVQIAIAAGTATNGVDYTASTTSLSFAAGQTSRTIEIALLDDSLDEDDETLSVSLFNASGGAALGAPILATLTIADDDATPTLSVDNGGCSVIEGDSGTIVCDFVLRLSAISGRAVTFNTATADVSATSGADYTGHASTARSIPAGQTTLTISVPVIGDTLAEPVETFGLNAAGVVHAAPSSLSGNGSINDDDGAPALSIDDVTVNEGDSGTQPATFTVTLLPASAQTVSVNWSSANDTALAGSDYDAASGMLSFAPGQTSRTLVVPVRGDIADEPDETFRVNLTVAVNAALSDAQGQGTILDDDVLLQPGVLQLDVPSVTVGEADGTLLVRVHRSGGSDGSASVRVRTSAGSALPNVDYVPYDQVAVWSDGDATTADIEITLINGPAAEPDKVFSVTLSEITGATLGTPSSTQVLIRDGQVLLFANGFEGQ